MSCFEHFHISILSFWTCKEGQSQNSLCKALFKGRQNRSQEKLLICKSNSDAFQSLHCSACWLLRDIHLALNAESTFKAFAYCYWEKITSKIPKHWWCSKVTKMMVLHISDTLHKAKVHKITGVWLFKLLQQANCTVPKSFSFNLSASTSGKLLWGVGKWRRKKNIYLCYSSE